MDYKKIYKILFVASKSAGIVAKMMQKTIHNEGKEVDELVGEDDRHKAMREAKTSVDEMVQEILLQSLVNYHDMLSVDAEEATDSLSLFTKKDNHYTLVIDPIDGTLDYTEQKDTYSICSAILHNHDIKVALVYFPARDELFGYYEGGETTCYQDVTWKDWNEGTRLSCNPQSPPPKIIYKNSRLSQNIVKKLQNKGFEVMDDAFDQLGCPDALRKCMYGESLAYFSDTRNIRDILMGAILGKQKYGHYYTYEGEEALWNSHGRQKEIVFTIYDKKEIFK